MLDDFNEEFQLNELEEAMEELQKNRDEEEDVSISVKLKNSSKTSVRIHKIWTNV